MGLAAEVMNIAKDPLAIGLLGTVGVVVRAEHLAHLVHELEAGMWAKFRLIVLLGCSEARGHKRKWEKEKS
jgi:hypothetical protein